jgi:hypothetical protein
MLTDFWYDGQLRAYWRQCVAVFSGLHVQTGVGECGDRQLVSVPCVIGSKDRVVAALAAGNTHNRSFALPIMALNMTALDVAPERRRTPGVNDARVTLPTGGVFPDDLRVVQRAMPVPYDMTMELAIYASNTEQLHQILEQLLVLFNPDIQLQKSDAPFDWTRLTRMELTGLANEENYPAGTDRRVLVWTLTFLVPIYVGLPIGLRDEVVHQIKIRLTDGSVSLREIGADGSLEDLDVLAEIDVDPSGPVPPSPVGPIDR